MLRLTQELFGSADPELGRGNDPHHPDVFDVGRSPTRHIAFGFGDHCRLATRLARREARVFSNDLLPRLHSIELAGEPAYMRTLFVGGPKHLPIRYRVSSPMRHPVRSW